MNKQKKLYKCKELGKITTMEEIEKEFKEILNNSSYNDEELEDIKELDEYIKFFYVEEATEVQ